MDNQIIIFWIIIIVAGLIIDFATYFLLRSYWQKNGVLLSDVLIARVFDRLDLSSPQLRKAFPVALRTQSLVLATHTSTLESLSTPEADAELVEIVPVSVEKVGDVRRVEFSIEMPLNTNVEVRIGATSEAGVTVEKREL